MARFRRILRDFWFGAAISIILSLAIVATSVMYNTRPAFAAEAGAVADTVVKVPAIVSGPDNPRPDPGERPDTKAVGRANADSDTDIVADNCPVKLHIPKGAVGQEAEIEIIDHGSWGSTSSVVSFLELNAYPVQDNVAVTGTKIKKFNKDLTISIQNRSADLAGLDLDTLQFCYLNEKTKQWEPVKGTSFDRETNTLTASINHFSYYGEVANPVMLRPGRVLEFLKNLHSGAAMTDYAIQVPTGSGGFTPSVKLLYNSASVDEMKNKKSMGSWVGIGWSLSMGGIEYDAATGWYFLSIDGQTYYRLSQDAAGVYHTDPESFFKITRNGQQWDVYDRDGTYYRFGGTADSQQYYDDSTYYRWDLSYRCDTNTANIVTFSYVQDKWTDSSSKTHVRAAYLTHVSYNDGLVDILFNSSYYATSGTEELRRDTPVSPKPKVAETRKLDSIEVTVDSSLVRKYVFSYTTTDDTYSSDYGGTYYAGKHKLNTIKEYGADGTSSLPTTTFTYTDKRIYHYDDCDTSYTGNPGNPASLYWPYLTSVANGYGATITYAYTEDPVVTSSLEHIWTREVVTSLTKNPGTGSTETYQYTYTGNPQYMPRGPWQHAWDDQYRGFPQVRVTDAVGNYADHYFYTTGTCDTEIMTGNEYKTQWYNSSTQLLETEEYTWNYRFQDTEPAALGSGGVAYWRMDENTGQTIADSSGNGHNGTLGYNADVQSSDPSWARTRYSSGLSFDGTNDYAKIATDSSLSLTGSFTLSACVKRSRANTEDCIIAYGTGGDILTYDHQYLLGLDRYEQDGNSYKVVFGMGNSTHNGYYHIHKTNTAEINDADWHTVTVTFNSSTGESVIYIDGISKSTKTGTTGSRLTSGLDDGRIGSVAAGAKYFFGYIDDVRIYSRVLSPSEVSELAKWSIPFVYLEKETDTIGTKTSQTRYEYDAYGNVTKTHKDGDTSIATDDSVIERDYYPNTSANILSCTAAERIKDGSGNTKQETLYYYDGHDTSVSTPPTNGNLTRTERKKGDGTSISDYATYDTYGNSLTEEEPNGNVTTTTYEDSYNALPETVTYPLGGQSENYTWDTQSANLLALSDVNSVSTNGEYDTFGRPTKLILSGDDSTYPTVKYEYNNYGTLNQQHRKTLVRVTGSDYLWKSEYFDGLGRVIQTQVRGETGRTIIESTTVYNNRGQVEKVYVAQDLDSTQVNGYKTPDAAWKYTSYVYDGLGRVTSTTEPDGTVTSTDYSAAWQQTVTNPRGYKHRYYYDAFGQLTKVEELDASQAVYATTNYAYDVLGNLVQTTDANGNVTTAGYDWLSRKTSMSDPDMGNWTYTYDNNSNLTSQTDAKGQTTALTYDALNRLTGKTYPAGSGMTNVVHTYDSTSGGNYGIGRRTGMTDASGTTTWKYDARGRLIQEKRTVGGVDYVAGYTYDSADRVATITYPTGETVTQTYNGRGMPYGLSGSVAGSLVSSTLYNQLGDTTRINLGNGTYDTFTYYGLDNSSGYYGKPWEVKTTKTTLGDRQSLTYTWDANGNVTQRQDAVSGQTETFTYDFLDRLAGVSGAYSNSYAYNKIGNVTSFNGNSYTYGTKPHAVTAAGSTSYAYDANGNMTTRGTQTLTWDVENRMVGVTGGGITMSAIYDGDGNRVKKTEAGETVLYVNKYYEKNLTSGVVTTHYYLGDREIAYRKGTTLEYISQDLLGSTVLTTNSTGATVATVAYFPFGATRTSSGTLNTDRRFTGQRLDQTGLYFYNARFYDATIGRFASADTIVPDYKDPQDLNRYTYCLNNPLKYVDPTGHDGINRFKKTWYGKWELWMNHRTCNKVIAWVTIVGGGLTIITGVGAIISAACGNVPLAVVCAVFGGAATIIIGGAAVIVGVIMAYDNDRGVYAWGWGSSLMRMHSQ